MFDATLAFKHLSGRTLSLTDFKKELRQILVKHVRELPAETTVRDLYFLASRERWITETANQAILVRLPETEIGR